MSDNSNFDALLENVIDQYLLFLRGRGPQPDLGLLTPEQRQAVMARLEMLDALADRGPTLPAIEDDPVAMRLGLVPDRRSEAGHTLENPAETDATQLQTAGPVQRVLDELELAFEGQVDVDWSPPWLLWQAGDLKPLAQCSVLGDSMALFVTEQLSWVDEPALLASFLRAYPSISAVGVVSHDASRAAIMSAASCNWAIDPLLGWIEPGRFIISESLDLALAHYFQQRLPRWDRVATLSELLELGDINADTSQVVASEIDVALRAKPRLEHKKQAQVALRGLDPQALSSLVLGVQAGKISGVEMADQLQKMAEATS